MTELRSEQVEKRVKEKDAAEKKLKDELEKQKKHSTQALEEITSAKASLQ